MQRLWRMFLTGIAICLFICNGMVVSAQPRYATNLDSTYVDENGNNVHEYEGDAHMIEQPDGKIFIVMANGDYVVLAPDGGWARFTGDGDLIDSAGND